MPSIPMPSSKFWPQREKSALSGGAAIDPAEMADDQLLSIQDLSISFTSVAGSVRAVNEVDLQVKQGEIMGLVGESGCGKSVTARSIVGLNPSPPAIVERGRIWLRTHNDIVDIVQIRNPKALRALRGRTAAMVFQEPMRSLHPMMSIGRQIVEAISPHLDMELPVRERAIEMLELVGMPHPGQMYERFPHELSGGMRQRAMIALALISRPRLLIADEPTTALDVTIQAQILQLIRDLQRQLGMAVLLITHNMGVIAKTADRVTVMYLGTVVESGTVTDIFSRASHPYTQGLLASMPSLTSQPKTPLTSLPGTVPELASAPTGCVFVDRCPAVMDVCVERPPTVEIEAGHSVRCWLYQTGTGPDHGGAMGFADGHVRAPIVWHERDPAPVPKVAPVQRPVQIQVEDLTLHYPIYKGLVRRLVGSVHAVDGVNFKIHVGETLGLAGESGCGKTSVGRLLTRLVAPTAGRVLFQDGRELQEISQLPPRALKPIRKAMGMVFQDPYSSLNPRLSVKDIVGEPLILHKVCEGKDLQDRVGELLEMVGLRPEHQSRFPHAFSGGQRQRIAIARALALNPAFLIGDEPVSALDVSVQSQILNLLMDLQQRLQLSMLFITHDLAVVRHVSDRVAVMYLGKFVEIGPTVQLCAQPAHPYTEGLWASIPIPDPEIVTPSSIPQGDLPDPARPPTGCRFHTRCPYRQELCAQEEPVLRPVRGNPAHLSACHFQDELSLAGVTDHDTDRMHHVESTVT